MGDFLFNSIWSTELILSHHPSPEGTVSALPSLPSLPRASS